MTTPRPLPAKADMCDGDDCPPVPPDDEQLEWPSGEVPVPAADGDERLTSAEGMLTEAVAGAGRRQAAHAGGVPGRLVGGTCRGRTGRTCSGNLDVRGRLTKRARVALAAGPDRPACVAFPWV